MTTTQTAQILKLLRKEVSFEFSRSSGPGGQNVNKVNSKVTLRWNPVNSNAISEAVKRRFIGKYAVKLTDAGEILLSSGATRDQKINKEAVISRLLDLISSVLLAPKKRFATKPTKGAKERRLKEKKQHSEKKRLRRSD